MPGPEIYYCPKCREQCKGQECWLWDPKAEVCLMVQKYKKQIQVLDYQLKAMEKIEAEVVEAGQETQEEKQKEDKTSIFKQILGGLFKRLIKKQIGVGLPAEQEMSKANQEIIRKAQQRIPLYPKDDGGTE